jgi:hypothetical protein
MGNDLYWIVTPKPAEPKEHSIDDKTRNLLLDLKGSASIEDLQGIALTLTDIKYLAGILIAADIFEGEHSDVSTHVRAIIEAIKKEGSITLVVHG